MATAIITIVAALVPLLVWWIQRKNQQADDPSQQNRERYEQIDKDIARALRDPEKSVHAAAHADADLAEFERLQRSRGH